LSLVAPENPARPQNRGVSPATALVGSHPVYQYLARRYGLNLISAPTPMR